MSRALLALLCGLALLSGAFSQNPGDPELPKVLGFTYDPGTNQYTASWSGPMGRTYFFQHSEDLIHWDYFEDVLTGKGVPIEFGFVKPSLGRFFVRLISIVGVTASPLYADSDGDKVPNGLEIIHGTDPLHSGDIDGDHIPDDWESRYEPVLDFGDPNDGALDPDGDGFSNLAEYLRDSDPTDFYNGDYNGGVWPDIVAVSGNHQQGDPGTFSAQPLVLRLTRLGVPVDTGPVTLTTGDASNGQISLTNDGNGLTTTLDLSTDSDGRVSVFFKHPAAIPPFPVTGRGIVARVGSTTPYPRGNHIMVSFFEDTVYDYTYPPNTVGRYARQAIDSRIAGKHAATALRVFTTQDHTPPVGLPTYVRNTNSWCYDLRQQMTCISPWNSHTENLGGSTGAGTAITAQHIILSAHYELAVGDTVRFITADNPTTVVSRILRGKARHSAYQGDPIYYPDLTVYTLNTPLPGSITPCKMLPANYANRLSYLELGRPPVMLLDQEEKALVSELRELGTFADFFFPVLHLNRLNCFEAMIGGDSGNPAFLIIKDSLTLNDTLVLLSTATFAGTGKGTFVTPQISALNAMIAAADAQANAESGVPITGMTVQTIDLSGFDTFTAP